MTEITLIRPPSLVAQWAHTAPTCPPIGVAYLAATLRQKGHPVHVVDAIGSDIHRMDPLEGTRLLAHGLPLQAILERIPQRTDVIGLSIMFSHEWPLVKKLIQGIRKQFPDTLIVAGGEHSTSVPEFCLEDCPELDVAVLGEGEETLLELAETFQRNRSLEPVNGLALRSGSGVIRTATRRRIRDINAIPKPAWDLFPLDEYLDNGFGFGVNRGRSLPILATRGCPYQCTFCSNPLMWTTAWVARDPVKVVEEMEEGIAAYGAENFDFYDLTAIIKRSWIVEFCELLIARGIRVTWQLPSGTRSEAIDRNVSRLLYRSGCRNLSYAPESGSPTELARIKKKIRIDPFLESLSGACSEGLNVKANIILGLPEETHEEVRETLRFMLKMAWVGVHDVSISPFSPYPGSELFNDLRREGKIPELDDHYFYSLAAYSDLTHHESWTEHIGPRALGFYRIFGMLMFYTASYAFRPWRFFLTFRNLLLSRHESRLEMSLSALLQRVLPHTR